MGNNEPFGQDRTSGAVHSATPYANRAEGEATVLVVAPRPADRQLLLEHLARHPQLKLQAMIAGEPGSMGIHVQARADLLLLAMPEHYTPLSGRSILPPADKIILITQWPQHAVDAFEHDITDVLLRPYTADRFDLAIERALGPLSRSSSDLPQQYIVLPAGRRSILVPSSAVLWVKAAGNHVQIHMNDRTIKAHCNLKQIAAMLPAEGFKRIHRSYIVAARLLVQVRNGKILLGKKEVPVTAALIEENQERAERPISE